MKKFILATILMMLSFTARAEFNNVEVNLCYKDKNGNMTECELFGNIDNVEQSQSLVRIETAFENSPHRAVVVLFATVPEADNFIYNFKNTKIKEIKIDQKFFDTTIDAYDSGKATIVKSSDLVIVNK